MPGTKILLATYYDFIRRQPKTSGLEMRHYLLASNVEFTDANDHNPWSWRSVQNATVLDVLANTGRAFIPASYAETVWHGHDW